MKILVYDLHASESGALAILDDFYSQVLNCPDKNIEWIFVVSTPNYDSYENVRVLRYEWTKKSWFHRLYFECFVEKRIIEHFKPDVIFSLQNKGTKYDTIKQYVYLHFAFGLTDYNFTLRTDGLKLWIYQYLFKYTIFSSLRNVSKVIVQTQWMKDALISKANIISDNILVVTPDIRNNNIIKCVDNHSNKTTFFYPATAFEYKNHLVLLKACRLLMQYGFDNYEVIFTITPNANRCAKKLYKYCKKYSLLSKVRFVGNMKREVVFEMYSKSVLVFPTFVESFGMPLLEARMSNSVILASDQNFSREILKDYNNAYFFDASNAAILYEYMKDIISCKIINTKDSTDLPINCLSLVDCLLQDIYS